MKQSTGMTRKIAPRSDDFETYEEYKAYIEQVHTVLPLATDAETGKPISSEPASPWARPTDWSVQPKTVVNHRGFFLAHVILHQS